MTDTSPSRPHKPSKKGHRAAASRILAGGISASVAFGLVGAMVLSESASAPAAPAPVVIDVASVGPTASLAGTGVSATPSTKAAKPVARKAVTRSKAS